MRPKIGGNRREGGWRWKGDTGEARDGGEEEEPEMWKDARDGERRRRTLKMEDYAGDGGRRETH